MSSTPTLPEAWKPFTKDQPPAVPMVTTDQLDLIKRTVANGATADELKLYLYDCARQGVHPLDKLIHFTKRGGKYAPITSIDFMRTRAADTNEYAGSDDAVCAGYQKLAGISEDTHDNFTATVTVYRIVQGQRCPFTATARWPEYCPPKGQDHMWRKMPHTMLSKCAEALALRKGFPRQLAGLYAKEELEQAGPSNGGYVVEAPVPSTTAHAPEHPARDVQGDPPEGFNDRVGPSGGGSDPLPIGAVYITKVASGAGSAKGFLHHSEQPTSLHGMDGIGIYQSAVLAVATECCQLHVPVFLDIVISTTSKKPYVRGIKRVPTALTQLELDAEIQRQDEARRAGEIL